MVNSLHWLNDNTEFMNIGKPIDAAVLDVQSESTVKVVQALTIFVWPMLAVAFGGAAWWVRRR
jgi:nitrate reductase NapE component